MIDRNSKDEMKNKKGKNIAEEYIQKLIIVWDSIKSLFA